LAFYKGITPPEKTVSIPQFAREQDNSIVLYPNPVNYELKIMNYETIENVEIYDVYGRILTNSQFSILNSQLSIDVSHLASGMYFLKVGNKVVKIIKN